MTETHLRLCQDYYDAGLERLENGRWNRQGASEWDGRRRVRIGCSMYNAICSATADKKSFVSICRQERDQARYPSPPSANRRDQKVPVPSMPCSPRRGGAIS